MDHRDWQDRGSHATFPERDRPSVAARYHTAIMHTDPRRLVILLTVIGVTVWHTGLDAHGGSGTFTAQKMGTITVAHGIAYVVRDQRDARRTQVEILLTDVDIDAAAVQTAFDPHMTAINMDQLSDRNYVLLWVTADGTVGMNATYSKTMSQFVDDSRGGLTVTWTTRSASRLAGRLVSKGAVKAMDGATYTADLTFEVDVPAPPTGTPLPAGGGDPGQGLRALLAAAEKKDWNGIRAGSSPEALKTFDRSYNTPAENAESAAELLKAWMSTEKLDITGGIVESESVAVLDVEGELFPGQRALTRVRMVKAGGRWQFDRAARAGMLP